MVYVDMKDGLQRWTMTIRRRRIEIASWQTGRSILRRTLITKNGVTDWTMPCLPAFWSSMIRR